MFGSKFNRLIVKLEWHLQDTVYMFPQFSATSNRRQVIRFNYGLAEGADEMLPVLRADRLQDSSRGILSGFISRNCFVFVYDHKQRRFNISVFLPLDKLLFWAVELHLSEAAGLCGTSFSPTTILWLGAGLRCQMIFQTYDMETFHRQCEFVATITPVYDKLYNIRI